MDGYYEFAFIIFSTQYFMFPVVGALGLAILIPAFFQVIRNIS